MNKLSNNINIAGVLMLALQYQILAAPAVILSIIKEIKASLKKSEDIGPTEYTSLLVP